MEYGFKLNKKNADVQYKVEMQDCNISGNTVQYRLKDNSIIAYQLDENGYAIASTKNSVENVELTRTQLSVFQVLADFADKNENGFDKKDLKKLDEFELGQKIVSTLATENSSYNLTHIEITKNSVQLSLDDYNGNEKKLKIEFPTKKFSNYFKSLFKSNKKEKPLETKNQTQIASIEVGNLEEQPIDPTNLEDNSKVTEPNLSKREPRRAQRKARKKSKKFGLEPQEKKFDFKGEIEPEYYYSIKKGETGLKIAQKLGIPLSCLMSANTGLDWNNLSVGQVITIPSRKTVENCTITDSTDVAFYTGFSENFINKLIKNEGFSSTPYWDVKRFSVGYGHSGRILGKYINDPNVPSDARVIMSRAHVENNMINITEADACHILAQDILDRIAEAEAYFGEAFSRAPKSLQAGIVDIIFNAGVEKSFEDDNTKFIKYNLDNGDYISAVKNLLLYEDNKKLYKRNAYRILIALEDFSKTERSEVLESPEIKKHFNKTYQYLNSRNLQVETDMLKTIYKETLLL